MEMKEATKLSQVALNHTTPGNGHVHEVVRQAREELHSLLRQRAEVMKRIGTAKQTIAGLATLFGGDVLDQELEELVERRGGGRQLGFTKACRVTLLEARRPLSAKDVCEQLREKHPTLLSRHKDPVASVTTVLNRLVKYGEALPVRQESGRRAWQWVAENVSNHAFSCAVEPSSPGTG